MTARWFRRSGEPVRLHRRIEAGSSDGLKFDALVDKVPCYINRSGAYPMRLSYGGPFLTVIILIFALCCYGAIFRVIGL